MGNWNGTEQEARELFHKFFETEYEKMIRCAGLMLQARDDNAAVNGRAEVAVQETFALAWERREEVLSSEKPVGWLYRALQYKVREILREENRWTKRLLLYESQRKWYEEPQVSLDVEYEGIIPTEDFQLLRRIYIDGFSYREMCEELNLTKPALAVRVHRIKKKMRSTLKQ